MKKFCTSCNRLQDESSGAWIVTKRKRWACMACAQRRGVSWYAKDAELIRAKEVGNVIAAATS